MGNTESVFHVNLLINKQTDGPAYIKKHMLTMGLSCKGIEKLCIKSCVYIEFGRVQTDTTKCFVLKQKDIGSFKFFIFTGIIESMLYKSDF